MKSKKRKSYTKAFKEEAVKLITDEGYSFAEAGRNLGVNPNLISRWKRELERRQIGNATWTACCHTGRAQRAAKRK